MLTLTALVKHFGSNRAVDGLSLSVGKGEVFGLLGPNGAGKRTTVHMAAGLVEPTSGQVYGGGHGSPRQPSVRARIGVAPQALSLYELLTAEENLTWRRLGLDDADVDARRRHIPLTIMPPWIQPFSYLSPVRWAIISFEGAIWRGFSIAEMAVPCAILIGIGAVAFAIGARRLQAALA